MTIQVKDANANTQTVSTVDDLLTVVGSKTDVANSSTDNTAVSHTAIFKQMSKSLQAIATGGGGSAVTIADGADTTFGTKADAANTSTDTTAISAMSVFKQMSKSLQVIASGGGSIVTIANATIKAANTIPTANDTALVVAISPNSVNPNGQQTMANSSPVVIASNQSPIPTNATQIDQYGKYNTVSASQTTQALTGGSGGATGDYLAYITIFPATAGCGAVSIYDNTTLIGTFAGGGTTALPSLAPFTIYIGAFSSSGAWKITTGTNVSALAVGKFT